MIEWLALILLIPAILVPLVLLFGFAGCHLVFDLEEVPPPPQFESAFEYDLTLDRQREKRCIVQRIESLEKGGSHVRIFVRRHSSGDLTIHHLSISRVADPGNPDDYNSDVEDLTPVLSAPVAVPPDPGSGLWELPTVEYDLDPTQPLLLAFDIGQSGAVRCAFGVDPAVAVAFVGPAPATGGDPPLHEAGNAIRQPGYSPEDRIFLVGRIEVAE